MPHFLGLSLVAALLLLGGTGCKKETSTSANIKPTGVYALVSVDGKSVPCTLNHDGAALTLKSGSFTFNADSNCSSVINFSLPEKEDMNREVKAIYTQQGADITMQWEGADVTMGNVNGNTFTMTNEGMVFAYRK
jgi:hypothetical protein